MNRNKSRTTININPELKNQSKRENINISEATELGIKLKSSGLNAEDLEHVISSLKEGQSPQEIIKLNKIREDLRFRTEIEENIKTLTKKYDEMVDTFINPFRADSFWFEVEETALKLTIPYEKLKNILIKYINGEYHEGNLKNLNRSIIENIECDEQVIKGEKERICKILTYNILEKVMICIRKKRGGLVTDKEYNETINKGAYALNITHETLQNFCKLFDEWFYSYKELATMSLFTREEIIHFSNGDKYGELKNKVRENMYILR